MCVFPFSQSRLVSCLRGLYGLSQGRGRRQRLLHPCPPQHPCFCCGSWLTLWFELLRGNILKMKPNYLQFNFFLKKYALLYNQALEKLKF